MGKTLVIVPCGSRKVWDRNPYHGPTRAQDAYVGHPFRVNRRYAERFGDRWVILSAKYGFVPPGFLIPGQYEVTFARKSSNPVSVGLLREQVRVLGLDAFATVIGLGGRRYREAVEAAFNGQPTALLFPFAGLPLGKAIQATQRAIENVEHDA
jgi:hypothetical protein